VPSDGNSKTGTGPISKGTVGKPPNNTGLIRRGMRTKEADHRPNPLTVAAKFGAAGGEIWLQLAAGKVL
jgi:hypothetical protein